MANIRDLVHGQLSEVAPSVALQALQQRWALVKADEFTSDVDVLNYALTLEHLEAAYYRAGLAAGLVTGTEKGYLTAIGADEVAHISLLNAAVKQLGGRPTAAPKTDFGSTLATRKSFLETSQKWENTGVSAYLGAASAIKDKSVLSSAAGIYGVHARHAAVLGKLLGAKAEGGIFAGPFEAPALRTEVTAGVSPYIDQLPGATPAGAPQTGGGSTVATDTALVIGGAALVGAAGLAAYAAHRQRPGVSAG